MDSAASIPNALAIALLLAVVVAGVGRWRGWLSASGFWAAIVVGGAVFVGGVPLIAGLLFFFFAAGLMGRLARGINHNDITDQHAPRTAGQVLAVGLCPAAAGVAWAITGQMEFLVAGLSSLAFAVADTWATDIGMTASAPPRLLGVGKRVAPGLSGGMSWRGTLGSAAGALAMAGIGMLTASRIGRNGLIAVAVIGMGAALLDSVLGATCQVRRRCTVCGSATEREKHCGRTTERVRPGLSNSGVNVVCSWGAGLAGWWWGS